MIYTQRGLATSHMQAVNREDISDFDIISSSKVVEVTKQDRMNLITYSNGQQLTRAKAELCYYFISGNLLNGKRSASNLLSRRLLVLDYDDIPLSPEEIIQTVIVNMGNYSIFLYPSTSYTNEKPKFRLVVDSERDMNQAEYLATIKDLAEQVGLPYDPASEVWAQMQGLPITDDIETFKGLVYKYKGEPFPVRPVTDDDISTHRKAILSPPTPNGRYKGKVIQLLEEVKQGVYTGGRNAFYTKAFGTLITAGMTPAIAIGLCVDWNEMYSQPPLSSSELNSIFNSISEREKRKEVS